MNGFSTRAGLQITDYAGLQLDADYQDYGLVLRLPGFDVTFLFLVIFVSWIGLLTPRLELEFPADSLADEDRQLLRYLAFPDFGPSRSAVESAVFPLRFRRGSGASRGVSRTGRSPCGPGPKREDGFYYAASSFQQLLGGFKILRFFCMFLFMFFRYAILSYCINLIGVPSQKKGSSKDWSLGSFWNR